MRVLVILQFEEGDPQGEVSLAFVDGSEVTLSHEKAQAQLGLEAFDAEAPSAPAAPAAPPSPAEDSHD